MFLGNNFQLWLLDKNFWSVYKLSMDNQFEKFGNISFPIPTPAFGPETCVMFGAE